LKKNIFVILFSLFSFLVISLIYSGCELVPSQKHTAGVKKLYNQSLSTYGWSDYQADQIIKVIGKESFQKTYIYIFLAQENVDLSSTDEIIIRSGYVGIPFLLGDGKYQYVFFSNGVTPFEIDLKKPQNASF